MTSVNYNGYTQLAHSIEDRLFRSPENRDLSGPASLPKAITNGGLRSDVRGYCSKRQGRR